MGELGPLKLCQEKKKDSVCDYFPVKVVEFFKISFFCPAVTHNGCRILKKPAVRQRCL